MAWLEAVWSEFFGLFVDDGSFAGAILLWLAVTWLLRRLGLPPAWPPAILFAGLAVILVESAMRRARRQPVSAATFEPPTGRGNADD